MKNFDDYDTFDSRGLLYEEESIKEVPIVRKEKQGFTHWSMPMFLFHDNKTYSGKVDKKEVARAHKKGKDDEELLSVYIYQNKKQVQPEEVFVSSRPAKTRPLIIEDKDELVHTPMPMYLYYDDTVYQGKYKPNNQKEPKKTPKKVKTEVQPMYIYKPEIKEEVFIEPESSKKILPVVVKQESEKLIANDNVVPDEMNDKPIRIKQRAIFHMKDVVLEDIDVPSSRLPEPPTVNYEPSITKEDHTPVILIPATLREESPPKTKRKSPKKKKKSPEKKEKSPEKLLEEPKHTYNPNLMKSYNDQTEKIEKSRLTKLDDLDHNDMFVPMKPMTNKSDPKDCLCAMCEKNKSRIPRPRKLKKKHKNPEDEDPEAHQKFKLESRINRLPKLNKPKKIRDPYSNRDKPRRNRNAPSQPNIKPDFSVSFAKFLKKNIETKGIKSKNLEDKNDKYLDNLGGDPTPKSKTSLGEGDNLDTYFDNQRRR